MKNTKKCLVICNNVGRAEQWAYILTFAALPPSDPRSGPSRLDDDQDDYDYCALDDDDDDDQDDYDYCALWPSSFSTLMVMMPWSGFQIESQGFWRAGKSFLILICQKLQPCWQWLLRNYHIYCYNHFLSCSKKRYCGVPIEHLMQDKNNGDGYSDTSSLRPKKWTEIGSRLINKLICREAGAYLIFVTNPTNMFM